MAIGFVAEPDALESDAVDKFDVWSQTLDAMKKSLPMELDSTAWSTVPGAAEVRTAFQGAVENLEEYINDGSSAFEDFARTLLTAVRKYMISEDFAQSDINRISGELNTL